MTNHSQWKTVLHQKINLSTQIHNVTEKMVYPSLVALMLMSHDQYGMSFCMRITFFYSKGGSRLENWCMARVLSFLIRYFSNYNTLHRSDLAARAAPLDPRLYSSLVSLLFWCWCLSKWCRSFTDMASPQLHHIPVRYETINDDKKVFNTLYEEGK